MNASRDRGVRCVAVDFDAGVCRVGPSRAVFGTEDPGTRLAEASQSLRITKISSASRRGAGVLVPSSKVGRLVGRKEKFGSISAEKLGARLASPQPRPASPVNGAGGITGCGNDAQAFGSFQPALAFFQIFSRQFLCLKWLILRNFGVSTALIRDQQVTDRGTRNVTAHNGDIGRHRPGADFGRSSVRLGPGLGSGPDVCHRQAFAYRSAVILVIWLSRSRRSHGQSRRQGGSDDGAGGVARSYPNGFAEAECFFGYHLPGSCPRRRQHPRRGIIIGG
jgi:hypothetical protein